MRRPERHVVRDFVEAVCTGNAELLLKCVEALEANMQWRAAMRAVANSRGAPDDFRKSLLALWVRDGDHLRQEVNDDLALADGLRAMLPPYTGPAITLYRGESARNRQRRTYGLSWSATVEVARTFTATGKYRTYAGGSVLLETLAPTEAIICAPVIHNDRYGEQEYLVDRRRLRSVRVLERYRQLTHDEYRHSPRRAAP